MELTVLGLCKQIHAKFGISTPRNSTSLRYGGKAVAVSDMMPGDVVCYEGQWSQFILVEDRRAHCFKQ